VENSPDPVFASGAGQEYGCCSGRRAVTDWLARKAV
jgi:hypothetical protein